mmetsp:Transcript_48954/g.138267  ORF Transcript_48954/g.138267 Transcript_48954/m.138267 type:complete len:181 (-) Transcript_48954:243-785(-)
MTGALGECPNFIGDDGARALAASLSTNRTLRSLSLVHNQLSILALQAFADLASVQNDLVHLELDQFGYEGPAAGLGLGAGQEGDKGGAGGGEQSVAAVHLHEVIRISLKHNYEKLTPVERLEADEAVDPQVGWSYGRLGRRRSEGYCYGRRGGSAGTLTLAITIALALALALALEPSPKR